MLHRRNTGFYETFIFWMLMKCNYLFCYEENFPFFNKKWMGISIKRMRYHYVASKKMKASVSIKWLNCNRNINFNDFKNSKILVILIKNTDHWKELFFHYLLKNYKVTQILSTFSILPLPYLQCKLIICMKLFSLRG